jgi:hypothetical protein
MGGGTAAQKTHRVSARCAAVGMDQGLECRESLLAVGDASLAFSLQLPAGGAVTRPEHLEAVFETSEFAHNHEKLLFDRLLSHAFSVPRENTRRTSASRGGLVPSPAVQVPHGRYIALRVLEAHLPVAVTRIVDLLNEALRAIPGA